MRSVVAGRVEGRGFRERSLLLAFTVAVSELKGRLPGRWVSTHLFRDSDPQTSPSIDPTLVGLEAWGSPTLYSGHPGRYPADSGTSYLGQVTQTWVRDPVVGTGIPCRTP